MVEILKLTYKQDKTNTIMKKYNLIIFLIIGINISVFSQEKYAVIIATQPIKSETITLNTKHKQYWIETFLMWEKLQIQGYSPENIYVLFNNGINYQSPSMADRFKPDAGIIICDDAATKANMNNLFISLKNGSMDFPKLNKSDTLFIWTYEKFNAANNNTIQLLDGKINIKEFNGFVNPIKAYKILNINNKSQ